MTSTEQVLAQIDGAIGDWEVGPDAMRCGAPAVPRLSTPRFDQAAATRVALRITAAFDDFRRGMAEVAKSINRLVEESPNPRKLLGLPVYDRHHPRPLSIDGAAYHRRRKARARRR